LKYQFKRKPLIRKEIANAVNTG